MQNTAQNWLVVLLATGIGTTLTQAAQGAGNSQAEAHANQYLGIISAANSLPVLFGALYGGLIADRYSKRTIVLWTQMVQGLLALGLGLLVWRGHVQVWHVAVFALLLGVTNVFDVPARQAFVVDMVGKRDLANAIALNSSLFNAARAFGPALAGILLSILHRHAPLDALARCFFVNAASYVAVIIGLLMMRGDFSAKTVPAASPLDAMREVLAYLQNRRPALLLFVLVAVFSLCAVPYFILLASFAHFTLGLDAQKFGLLMSSQGIGALAGALTVATLSEYNHKGRLITLASIVFPALLILLSFTRSFSIACALTAALGYAMICFLATANSLLQTSTPDDLRGRVMGLYSLILMGLTPIGSLWAGAVAKAAGAATAIAVGGLLIGIAGIVVALRYPRFRNMGQTLPESL